MQYGSRSVTASLDKDAREDRGLILVRSSDGRCLRLDCTTEPGRIDLDGQLLAADGLAETFPRSLTTEIAYLFAQIKKADVMNTEHRRTDRSCRRRDRARQCRLVARQTQEVRPWLWKDLPACVPDNVERILRHQLLDPLLRHGLVDNPKDNDALDRWVGHAFRIAHRFSRDPWAGQSDLLTQEGLDALQLVRLNAAMRDSDFLQNLIVREGMARQYWSMILRSSRRIPSTPS